jgi:outer membrane protein OmpA-like peptidoglycan-associated protein
MLVQPPRRKRRADEAEKPFWISFSDLMTALMVLFLVAMAVALMGVTQGLRQMDESRQGRQQAIESCLTDLQALTQQPQFQGVRLRGQTLEFGPLAEFSKGGNALTAERAQFLRTFMPQVLAMARTPGCQTWLKRFVVEGYASPEGSYLYNLNLSLERSQRFLCALLDASAPDALAREDRQAVRELFLVGGSSFNSAILNKPEKSRRVELRLEFRDAGNQCTAGSPDCSGDARQAIPWDDDVKCPVSTR